MEIIKSFKWVRFIVCSLGKLFTQGTSVFAAYFCWLSLTQFKLQHPNIQKVAGGSLSPIEIDHTWSAAKC